MKASMLFEAPRLLKEPRRCSGRSQAAPGGRGEPRVDQGLSKGGKAS